MSLSHFAAPRVFAPLQGLWRRMSPTPAMPDACPSPGLTTPPAFAPTPTLKISSIPSANLPARKATTVRRPLRVVRVLESDHLPANVGRMVISGRMADVCAELDRLADREALH